MQTPSTLTATERKVLLPSKEQESNTRTVYLDDSTWRTVVAAFHPADRCIAYVEGEPALVVRVGSTGRVVRIVKREEENA